MGGKGQKTSEARKKMCLIVVIVARCHLLDELLDLGQSRGYLGELLLRGEREKIVIGIALF